MFTPVERFASHGDLPSMPRRIAQVLGGVLLGLVATLFWVTLRGLPEPIPPAGADVVGGVVPQPFAVPPLQGIGADGAPVVSTELLAPVTAVFFGYTSCPDVCPLTLARVGRYREDLPPELADRLAILFVSVDPARDTPERLARYAAALPGDVLAMTAPDIRAQAERWGVRATDGDTFGEDEYLVDHTARVFILNEVGEVVATLMPMPGSTRIAEVLDRLVGVR
jgi:protein SCO1/2